MTEKSPTSSEVNLFVEDVKAPELYASSAPFFAILNGVVTITLASKRWDNGVSPAVQRNVTVGRLVMPAGAAQELAVGLHDFLEKQGISLVSQEERERPQ